MRSLIGRSGKPAVVVFEEAMFGIKNVVVFVSK